MRLTIEREVDGRWIAEVPELNVLLYGGSKQDAIQRAQSAALEIVLDRITHGELPSDSANANGSAEDRSEPAVRNIDLWGPSYSAFPIELAHGCEKCYVRGCAAEAKSNASRPF
jgi:predicted RNase H-like HicB family nuclease